MRVHPLGTIKELKKLRKRGFSINALVAKFSIPKSTVWHHVHNVKILPKYQEILRYRAREGTARFAQRRWEKAKILALQLFNGPERIYVTALATLYWGEGHKARCDFTNTDGRMMSCYLKVLRNVFKTPESSIIPTIRFFSGMNKEECLDYWAKVTKIQKTQFRFRFNDGGTRGRSKYGICRIVIKKGGDTFKLIMSLIDEVYKEIDEKLN